MADNNSTITKEAPVPNNEAAGERVCIGHLSHRQKASVLSLYLRLSNPPGPLDRPAQGSEDELIPLMIDLRNGHWIILWPDGRKGIYTDETHPTQVEYWRRYAAEFSATA